MGRGRTTRRTWPKKAAITVLTPAVLTPLVSVGLLAEAAGAGTQDQVWNIGDGTTCILRATRTHPLNGNPAQGRGTTQVLAGSGPFVNECTDRNFTVSYVSATFRDLDGNPVSVPPKESFGSTTVTAVFQPIGAGLVTRHSAFNTGCVCTSPTITLTK
jgi:hypothetical protein